MRGSNLDLHVIHRGYAAGANNSTGWFSFGSIINYADYKYKYIKFLYIQTGIQYMILIETDNYGSPRNARTIVQPPVVNTKYAFTYTYPIMSIEGYGNSALLGRFDYYFEYILSYK